MDTRPYSFTLASHCVGAVQVFVPHIVPEGNSWTISRALGRASERGALSRWGELVETLSRHRRL